MVWNKPFKLDQDIVQTYQTHGLEYLLNAFGERSRAFLNNKEKIYTMGRWHYGTKAATFLYLCFINGGTMAYDDYVGQYFISFPRQ
ncbi:polyferredoxin [Siphonobacter sp. SORGH_AS 1065]|nr:polyferredoxin [Siphonobacter sp. SORGH_AS_1065]